MINNMHKFLFPIKLILFVIGVELMVLYMIIRSILIWKLPTKFIIITNESEIQLFKLLYELIFNDIKNLWKKN